MAMGQGPVNKELSEIVNKLWSKDVNRLKPGKDYIISLQGRAGFVAQGSNQARDQASAPLFSHVNEEKLQNMKTYSYFMNLLDNYETSTGVSETVTQEEVVEMDLFLDSIMGTEVIKCAHQYLISKGQAQPDSKQFKKQLYDIWFRLYNRDRSGGADSCGFEHVFVGETKYNKEITGFHNWIQFYLQEKLGFVDYKGFKAKDIPNKDDHVLNLQFSWKGLVKPVGSSFIGVSPEFEVALFTLVFLMSGEKTTSVVIQVDRYLVEVVVSRHGRSIGTSYPKLLSSTQKNL